jgi:hypothetical protein
MGTWALRFSREVHGLYPGFSIPDEVKTSHPLWAILFGFQRYPVAIEWGERQPPLFFNFLFFELSKFGSVTTENKAVQEVMVHLFIIINNIHKEMIITVWRLCAYGLSSFISCPLAHCLWSAKGKTVMNTKIVCLVKMCNM